jgi:hypothetical protein
LSDHAKARKINNVLLKEIDESVTMGCPFWLSSSSPGQQPIIDTTYGWGNEGIEEKQGFEEKQNSMPRMEKETTRRQKMKLPNLLFVLELR